MTTLKASTRDYIGFSPRGLKENGSWQEGKMPSMQCEAPVVMSGFAGFHGGVAPSSDVVPTLASASASSLIVGGAGNKQSGDVTAFNHARTGGDHGDQAPTLMAHHNEAPGVLSFSRLSTMDIGDDLTPTQRADESAPMVEDSTGDVRKLTPIECEVLQGFAPGYTAIPTGKRNRAMEDPEMFAYQKRVLAHLNYTDAQLMTLLPDGARYKAIGNSWAVPCAAWIGERIEAVQRILDAQPRQPRPRRRLIL